MTTHLPALEVLRTVLDPGTLTLWDEDAVQPDLGDTYAAQLSQARERSGIDEALITGEGLLDGRRVAVAAGEFAFLAGSIGAAASERLTLAVERATRESLPFLASPSSGGTRMQEGTPAFLQMVKIAQAVVAHKRAGLPYLVYLRHPTTGGVLASWGSLGHLTIGEPGALIGFLGPRVREVIRGEPFPEGVQLAENLARRGVIDGVVALSGVRTVASKALAVLLSPQHPVGEHMEPTNAVVSRPAWESVQATRLFDRPGLRDLIHHAVEAFIPLRGTGSGESDLTVIMGLARLSGFSCILVGQDRQAQQHAYLGPAALRVAQRGFQLAEELELPVSATLENGANATLENEATGLSVLVCRVLGSDAGQGVDAAVA